MKVTVKEGIKGFFRQTVFRRNGVRRVLQKRSYFPLFSGRYESYVPQKLFHRRKFLRHKYNKSGVVTAINIYTHPSNLFGNEDS